MNKSELIATVAEQADLSKTKTEEVLNIIIDTISSTLRSGGDVKLIGFGTFKTTNKAATTARNPRTGEEVPVPAKKLAKFVAGKALKDTVNS